MAPSVATDEQNILILEVFTYQQQMFSPVPPLEGEPLRVESRRFGYIPGTLRRKGLGSLRNNWPEGYVIPRTHAGRVSEWRRESSGRTPVPKES